MAGNPGKSGDGGEPGLPGHKVRGGGGGREDQDYLDIRLGREGGREGGRFEAP